MCLCGFPPSWHTGWYVASGCSLRKCVSSISSQLLPVPQCLYIWEMNSGSSFVDESLLFGLLACYVFPMLMPWVTPRSFHSGSVAFPCGPSVLCGTVVRFMPRKFGSRLSFASPGVQDLCPKFQVSLLAPGPLTLEDSKPSLRFLSFDLCGLETHPSASVHYLLCTFPSCSPSRPWEFE